MKVLVATEKPFAKVAVDGIRKEVEAAGYELALLEKYTEKAHPQSKYRTLLKNMRGIFVEIEEKEAI